MICSRAIAIAAAAVALILPVGRVHAQTQDAALLAFADSLTHIADTAAVRRLEPGGPPAESAPLDAHIRSGLVEMRIYELSEQDAARRRAERSFERAKDLDARSVWAHYGLGWTTARSREFSERFFRFIPGSALVHSIGAVVGTDAKSTAIRSLRRALAIDPSFEPAVVELGRIALKTKSPDDVATAAAATRHAVGTGARSGRVYAQLSELELLFGDPEAAANAARAGVTMNADGLAQRALGVALLAQTRQMDEGGTAYMGAITPAAFADADVAATYFADVSPLLVKDERDRWEGMRAEERAAWLTRFWERSAAKSARTLPQRLQEHFTRVRYANANYQRLGAFGQNAGTAFRMEKDLSLPIDDRGILYIRLGKPMEVISTPSGDMTPPPNASWVYRRDGKFEMYHFHQFKGSSEWLLSPLEECDPFFIKTGNSESDRHRVANTRLIPQTTQTGGIGAETRYLEYIRARAKYDERLNALVVRCEMAMSDVDAMLGRGGRSQMASEAAAKRLLGSDGNAGGSVDMLILDGREWAHADEEVARRGMAADDARPRYEAPLQVITQLYAFRGAAASTSLMAAVLVPGERFTPYLQNGVHIFPLSLSVIVLDSVSGKVEREDGQPAFRADQGIGENQYFRAMLDLEATPTASADYSIIVQNVTTPGEGDIRSGKRSIPSFSGEDLMLSDLVVGEEGDGRWRRGSITINPIPSHQIERDRTFKLFYEIYNLAASAPYRTTITVAPDERGGISGAIKSLVLGKKSRMELTFDDIAGAGGPPHGVQQIRSVSGDLDYGAYTITVTILDLATQRTTKRDARLVVLSPKDLKTQ